MISREESTHAAHPLQALQSEIQAVKSHVHWLKLNSYPVPDHKPHTLPVMCDFDIVQHDKPARFYVSFLVEVENSQQGPGPDSLFFSISTVTEFEYRKNAKPEALPVDEGVRWGLYSNALAVAYGIVRGYMVNYLAPTYYHDYILPSVDVVSLVNRKYVRSKMPAAPTTNPSEQPKLRRGEGKGGQDREIKLNDDLT